MASAQIFLSTVSAEFRSYRDALRRDLDRPNVTVKVQEDFIATGTETLDKLDSYIRQCDAVIHLVGDMTGALAQAPSVEVLRQRYPDLGERLPVLGPFLQPNAPALSYTQWEAWLALYHRKLLVIAVPQTGAPRDKLYTLDMSQRAAQEAHLARLAGVERYPEIWFVNADRLAVDVLRSELQDRLGLTGARAAGRPFQVPPLSDQYVERSDLLLRLKALAVPSRRDLSPSVTRIVLHGPGGAGKSVLASALAHDQDVQSVYSDGVLWASLGEGGDRLQRLSDWGRALKDSTVGTIGYADERTAVAQLRTLLNDRACLLVVDDARDPRSVKDTFLVGGWRSLLVVTTRWREVATAIGATEVDVGAMTHEEAMALLEGWAGDIMAADHDAASSLASELGHLPLALELMGARVARLGSWREYRRSWDTQRLSSLKRGRRAQGKEDNLEDSIEVSVQALPAADRDRYLQLAVMPQVEYFPASAAAVLWDCSASEASELLLDLTDQALVSRRSIRGFEFTLTNLFYEFVTSRLGEAGLARAHSAIVDGYRKMSPHGWPRGPNEPYYFEHLARHLAGCGRATEVHTLITVQWMKASLVHTGTQRAFLADVARSMDLAAQQRPPSLEQLIRGALVHSTIATLAGHMPAAALAVLAGAGHGERALAFAGVTQDPDVRHAAYVAIAEALLSRGERGDAVVALEQALGVVDKVVYDRPAALADIARLASRVDSATLLERTLALVGQSDAAASSAIALALGREGDQPRALGAARLCATQARALGDDVGISERLEVQGAAVRAFHAAGDVAEAARLLDDAQAFADRVCIDDDRARAAALVQLARSLADTGQASGAMDLATRAMGIVREVIQCAGALPALERLRQAFNSHNRLVPQESVIYAAARAIKAVEDQPDEVTMARSRCAALIHAERRVEDAWAFEIGCKALQAFDRAGEVAAAHGVTADLVSALGAMPRELREAALLQFVEGLRDLETEVVVSDVAWKVLSLIEQTTDPAERIRHLPELFGAFGRSHDDHGFERVLAIAEEGGSEFNGYALRSAVVVLCAKLDLERALAIRASIASNDEEYGLATAIIARGFAQRGDGTLARSLAREINDPLGRSGALADVAVALSEGGKIDDAVDAANHAIATAQATRTWWRDLDSTTPGFRVPETVAGETDKYTALTAIARALASARAIKRAVHVADVLNDPIDQSIALSQIAVEMAEAGDIPAAADVARRALTIATKPGEANDEDSASDALDGTAEATPATDAPPEDQILGSLTALMDPQGRARLSSWVGSLLSESSPDDAAAFAWRAVRAAQAIPDRTFQADIIWYLMHVSARVDDKALERDVLALADACGNSRAVSELADERAAVHRMRKEAEGKTFKFEILGREAARAEALAWAATALGKAGVHDQVAAAAGAALESATDSGSEEVRSQVLMQIAEAFGATNDLEALKQLDTRVPALLPESAMRPSVRICVASEIAYAWAKRDTGEQLTDAVEQLLSALTDEDNGVQAAGWGLVADVWRRAEKVPKAMDYARRAVSGAKALPDEERRVAILSHVAQSVANVDVALANEAAEAAAATAEQVHEACKRALALAAAGSALAQAGQDELALGMLPRALSSSRFAQRDCIFQVVAQVAQILGTLGLTEGLWALFQAVQEDDTWWAREHDVTPV